MKITKKIKAIAEKIAANDSYRTADCVAEQLTKVKKALLTGKYYTRVESVSKSGMSRIISIKIIDNGELVPVPDYVYKMAGCDCNDRICGCGMDMLFAAQYNIFVTLTDRKRTPYQTKMQRYRSL